MASILRLGAQRVAPMISARSFSVSAVKMGDSREKKASFKKMSMLIYTTTDLVQDLYVNQLKAYKPAAKTQNAHEGLVRSFSAPKAPSAPALPSDLASELSKFDAEEPSIGGSATAKTSTVTEGGESADEYLTFLEKDLPKADAHH